MDYLNGYIVVPEHGLYYIYGRMYFDPQDGQYWCGFKIYLNDLLIVYTSRFYENANGLQWDSRYSGGLEFANKGDRLHMKFSGTCYYRLYSFDTQFGAFRVA